MKPTLAAAYPGRYVEDVMDWHSIFQPPEVELEARFRARGRRVHNAYRRQKRHSE